jgi:hypothetical protein
MLRPYFLTLKTVNAAIPGHHVVGLRCEILCWVYTSLEAALILAQHSLNRFQRNSYSIVLIEYSN